MVWRIQSRGIPTFIQSMECDQIHKRKSLRNASPERAVQPFWINTSSNDIVKEQIEKNPSLKEKLQEFLEGKEIMVGVDPWLSLRELEERKEGVWTLLVSGGYLAARQHSF